MNFARKRKSISVIIAINCIILFSNIISISTLNFYSNKDISNNDSELITPEIIKEANGFDPKIEVRGSIDNQAGKIFCNISAVSKDSYINRYQSGLNIQPKLFLQNWNITHARMVFENITALNYTKNIETEPTEYIISYSETVPIYVYQKFSVETNQYVNNISIFIQDVVDEDYYSDENSWDVSIVNCSNDAVGTPNSNETLGTLKKAHPDDVNAHWEVFDFKNSDNGSIYLNTSNTNSTIEDSTEKFWFAIKIKIPPNDVSTGGGPKFLYLNPDEGDSNEIGEGDTFAQSPQFINLTYNIEDVTAFEFKNGIQQFGTLESFKTYDENRFIVTNDSFDDIAFSFDLEVANLTNEDYTWQNLKTIRTDAPLQWRNILNSIVFSINFSLVTNVSSRDPINSSIFSWWNPDPNFGPIDWEWFYHFNISQQNEDLQTYFITNPADKLEVIQHMNTSVGGNNRLRFASSYRGNSLSAYNISINLFNVDIGEITTIHTIQKYDPTIHDLHYCNNVTLLNSTSNMSYDEIIESLEENDNEFLEVIGDLGSNTTIIDFKFNILPEFNNSLWDVDDPLEWIFSLPNPRIFQIDFRISSNVSIQDPLNLTHAILEIYNGGDFPALNETEWIQFSDNKTFADIGENTKILPFDSFYSWYIMHLINESDDNSLRVRLRFIGNGSFEQINVSIDEFTLNFHIQNTISSDITSKIGFGIDSNSLKPLDIHLKNMETDISDDGIWEMDINNGVPTQGFYSFNVTSIWPEVIFDVSGIYTIEHSQNYNWEYTLEDNIQKVLWNVSSDISYYYYSYYTTLQNSRGLQFIVPSDWELMDIYDCSVSPPNPNGGWYSITQSAGHLSTITIYNIYDGSWKVSMNSSKSTLILNVNSTNTFIDKMIKADIDIKENYGGDVYFEIYTSDSKLNFSQTTTLNESSLEHSISYYWDIFSTTTLEGTYHLKAYWILYNETHAFLALNTTEIMVSKYNVDLEILDIEKFSKTFIYGDDILIKGKLTNNETGAIIEGAPIIVEIYDGNLNLIKNIDDITDNEGEIQREYTLPSGYSKISIQLVYNASGTYYSTGQSTIPLEINLISRSEYNLNIFIGFLPYIGVIIGISIATIVVMTYRKSKLRKFWAEEAKILDDLLKISHVMIIHKDAGVSIYDKQFSLENLDADLISGFLQAISAFRTEIKKGTTDDEGKGFEMDYGDFKIVLNDGKSIRVALILDGIPSEKLKENQELFTEDFEKKFETILRDFTGDITEFRKADDLIEKHFNISLTYPLQLAKHYDLIKIKGLDKALVEVANQIQKEKKYFFTSNLLNYALAGRKASRDEIISNIIDLKRRGIIIPASEE